MEDDCVENMRVKKKSFKGIKAVKVHSLLGLARFNQGLPVITFHRNVWCQ